MARRRTSYNYRWSNIAQAEKFAAFFKWINISDEDWCFEYLASMWEAEIDKRAYDMSSPRSTIIKIKPKRSVVYKKRLCKTNVNAQ